MEVLAIIPARQGSIGIPDKNIKDFAGHPLMHYSITAGLQAHYVDRVIVSTDSIKYIDIAVAGGAETPFARPAKHAGDSTRDFPVIEHALTWLREEESYKPDIIVQLRPTSPLRPAGLVDSGIELLCSDKQADSVRTVAPPHQNPFKMWQVHEGYLLPLMNAPEIPEVYNAPRQELPSVLWQTGHLEVFRYETVMQKKSLTGDKILPLPVDAKYCVDLDSPQDWAWGEQVAKSLLLCEN